MIKQLSVAIFVMVISVSCKPGIDVTYENWSDLDVAQNIPDEGADFDNTGDKDFDDRDVDATNDELIDSDEEGTDADTVPDADGTIEKSCENAICSGGFCFENGGVPECFCPFGSHDESLDCVENKTGSVCDGVTCSGYGDCFDAGGLLSDPICQCDDGYIPINLTCLKNLSGDPCDYIDCGPNSECVVSTSLLECECKAGFIEDESGWGCIEDVPDPCERKNCGDNGTCENVEGKAVCKCDDGYFYNGTTCVKESSMTCDDIKCSGHGDCLEIENKFYCKCDKGYYASGLECLKDTSVQCVDDFDCYYQCGMFNGKCVDSKCECS